MRKILMLAGAFVLCAVAGVATPRQAVAGCFCGSAGCTYDALNTAKCQRSGGICVMGGGCCICDPVVGAPAAFDGTISQSSKVASVESRPAALEKRACDGAVIARKYAADEARRLRASTRRLVV